MALQQFKLEKLAEFDGERLRRAFEQCMNHAISDCQNRPGLKKPRVVTLSFTIVPIAPETRDDDLETVKLKYDTKAKIPDLSREGLSLAVRKGGMLVYNDASPDNVNQRTFDDGLGE